MRILPEEADGRTDRSSLFSPALKLARTRLELADPMTEPSAFDDGGLKWIAT
jgi:hypothetical protein